MLKISGNGVEKTERPAGPATVKKEAEQTFLEKILHGFVETEAETDGSFRLFRVPRALYRTMNEQTQYMQYTQIGVKYIDEDLSEIFLLKMGALIENEGYDACLQRNVSNLRIQGDHTTNPELVDTYELVNAEPVEPGKPVPDVIIDFNKAAEICGLGRVGDSGHLIAPKLGPFLRMVFIVTDAPLECDPPFGAKTLCDHCGKCIKACPGNAIGENGVNSWQCAVYYRGAHKSNPFMQADFLADDPDRQAGQGGKEERRHFARGQASDAGGAECLFRGGRPHHASGGGAPPSRAGNGS